MTLSPLAFSLTTFPWSLQCLLVRPPLLSCHQALSFTILFGLVSASVQRGPPVSVSPLFVVSSLCWSVPIFHHPPGKQVRRGADVKSKVPLLDCSVIDIPGKGSHLEVGSCRPLLTASSPGAASGKSAGF